MYKIKTLTIGKQHKELRVRLDGEEQEQTTECVCLGGLIKTYKGYKAYN